MLSNKFGNPTGTMLSDPTTLTGSEQLVCNLNSSKGIASIWRRMDGQLVAVMHKGGLFGHFERADTRHAAAIFARAIGRASLTPGQLVSAEILSKPTIEHGQVTLRRKDELCRFIEYSDKHKDTARVQTFEGVINEVEYFEAWEFCRGVNVSVRVLDRWLDARFVGTSADGQAIVRCWLNGESYKRQGKVHLFTVPFSDLLAAEESVPCRRGEAVSARIDGSWVDNCRYYEGRLGSFSVRTRTLRMRQATVVRPMNMTASVNELDAA